MPPTTSGWLTRERPRAAVFDSSLAKGNNGRGDQSMLLFIVVSVVATVVAIAAYQLLLQKYYWGPKGPPEKGGRDKDSRRE